MIENGRPLVALAAATEFVDGVGYLAVREVYVRALERIAGCVVTMVGGTAEHIVDLLDRFDGVVFGGHQTDVLPRWYGGVDPPAAADAARDELALAMLPAALHAGIPVLGICRGLQELNVALGGTLRDLSSQPGGTTHTEDDSLPRDEQYLPAHEIRLARNGMLHDLLGNPTISVNSLHHQAIDQLACGLRVEAVAADGVIEAVSAPGHAAFCLAVQWHPEWYAETDPVSTSIFTEFGTAAKTRARCRTSLPINS
ncbi:MAG TPA: gamma-glutamyl-gamma-aminobutyrate hydrolase family protein [Amycolatopsis sp.]|uniref:gamma-glutamyl-gamma-aminobutyrate hydrolase family protein n=1 Tax=Amycolatopsis sp. TaxID=37632 RepID=UPI002B47089E|nr:gamma-glutamyl-gamma-aminobutyrate hydrolase family protein [Amycolatopsis sp.]HKS45055.1 gamma-glutamyl-gamma-aminobutyrate hydrolase family protein [Amycolatopsis sp.]